MMKIVHPSTSQTVFVSGFWQRLLASTIDTLLVGPLILLACWIIFSLSRLGPLPSFDSLSNMLEMTLSRSASFFTCLLISIFAATIYQYLFLSTLGATPGLFCLNSRVITIYGQKPESWRALIRTVVVVFSMFGLGLGLIWIAFDREKRGLPDWIAGTYVIRVVPTVAPHLQESESPLPS